jgi:hypothetical protein
MNDNENNTYRCHNLFNFTIASIHIFKLVHRALEVPYNRSQPPLIWGMPPFVRGCPPFLKWLFSARVKTVILNSKLPWFTFTSKHNTFQSSYALPPPPTNPQSNNVLSSSPKTPPSRIQKPHQRPPRWHHSWPHQRRRHVCLGSAYSRTGGDTV